MTHTPHELHQPAPIACSLAGAEYRERVAEIGRVAREALGDRESIDGGARLSFDETADIRGRLEALVAAESECCPFLAFNLSAADRRLVLEVTGPEQAAPIIEELFA
jgi:hypothetical protein